MTVNSQVMTLRRLYDEGKNIMDHLRQASSLDVNNQDAIEISYDLQSGSYINQLKDPNVFKRKIEFTNALASLIDELQISTMLDAGVGEATTLAHLLNSMKKKPQEIYGLDISWSRLKFAERYLKSQNIEKQINLFTSDLANISIADHSFELVLTCHAIEPNRGNEASIISELVRVSNKYVLMLEPASTFGSKETKAHIEKHRYCKNLHKLAKDQGLKVLQHRLFDYCANDHNQTELLLIETTSTKTKTRAQHKYGCPSCNQPLELSDGNYYCFEDALVFPTINGIPCLRQNNSILATKFLEF